MSNVAPCEARMALLTVGDILAATGGTVISDAERHFSGIGIDSRTIREGELFVALKGEKFDGHDFVFDALAKGSGAVVNRLPSAPFSHKTIILVHDTLRALQDIGRFYRMRAKVRVVGVTGTNGKTTSKELIAAVLGTRYHVHKTAGNLNNQIGLPLSLTRIADNADISVLEMGASVPGDIRELCSIALPEYGVITNIGSAHLEGFGDLDTVRRTKLEILEFVQYAVVNADDRFLMEGVQQSGYRGSLLTFGIEAPADVRATDIVLGEQGSTFRLQIKGKPCGTITAHIAGTFNIYNILAATSIGHLLDIHPDRMREAIASFTGMPMRMEFHRFRGITVIKDAYNANPASMKAALQELGRVAKGRKIAVLGDMLELGAFEEAAHREIGAMLSQFAVDVFIAVGKRMAIAASAFPGTVYSVDNPEEAGQILTSIWETGDTVLIKGSRGMAMEKVLGA